MVAHARNGNYLSYDIFYVLGIRTIGTVGGDVAGAIKKCGGEGRGSCKEKEGNRNKKLYDYAQHIQFFSFFVQLSGGGKILW